MKSIPRWTFPLVAFLSALVAVALVVSSLESPPAGVRDVVWDKQPCKECGMSVSDREFACQLQIADGDVHDFDDPGCLFQYILREKPAVAAAFFRELNGDSWLSGAEVGFVPTDRSPMDYGLAAVSRRKQSQAMTLEQAIAAFQANQVEVNATGR